jgi:hypothetical protein
LRPAFPELARRLMHPWPRQRQYRAWSPRRKVRRGWLRRPAGSTGDAGACAVRASRRTRLRGVAFQHEVCIVDGIKKSASS